MNEDSWVFTSLASQIDVTVRCKCGGTISQIGGSHSWKTYSLKQPGDLSLHVCRCRGTAHSHSEKPGYQKANFCSNLEAGILGECLGYFFYIQDTGQFMFISTVPFASSPPQIFIFFPLLLRTWLQDQEVGSVCNSSCRGSLTP